LQNDTLADGFELIAFDIGLIDSLPVLESALTELRPEVAIGGLEVFRSSQNLFLNRLANENGVKTGQTRSVETAALGDTLYAPVQKTGEQVWGQIQYVYHEQDGTGSNPDYYANSYELAAGISNLALGDVSFGFAVGYADIETEERVTAPDSSTIKVFRAGMTASANMNPSDSGLQAHIDGTASWAAGTHDISMNLVIPAAGVATAQSTSTDVNYVGAGIRLTVDGFDDNDWMLKPHVLVAWDNVHQDLFTIGSGPTAFTAESGNFDRTTFGYGLSMNHKWNNGITINASVSGYHYVGDTQIGLTSQFGQNSNGESSFLTTGENIRNQYVVEAGFEKAFGDGWILSADGFAEFGDLEAVGGLLKLRKKF
ncbi:autotransporter outer membrane beta-barrel domain-containing protein, partial [Parasphingorhabdus sp.]